ncbi:helix-turn-helix domain-containing protein [Chryseobacterium oryctis]|uniref:Helix-turn-helix transcriptional regulator n=1 Tax=Chryseobacterium oryctis TaxID=2952618 RepID=A0ABT3HJ04_9FLAO|nr:helix-turn-helix transcriptional regulator [Chryseobacterium oryctis]MCW3159768.1 helix-turn-helix transcriptional regulator [Chryseobacterium oryctis]
MKLSDKLFTTRTAKKLSKQEVADLLGMDVTTYGRVEAGKRNLEIDKLKLLPNALGIKTEEILDLLEIDKGHIFNINNTNEEYASGNGYVENFYTENRENLIEIKNLYTELLKQKDNMIEYLKKENEELKRVLKK